MLIEGQLVEVMVSAKTLKHYTELGYDVKRNDVILVPPEHLTRGSHAIVDVECDVCKKIIQKQYKQYLRGHTYNMDACSECYAEKIKLSCLNKYGVENVFQLEEVKQKTKNTLLNTYGCDHPMHNDEIKDKWKQTNLDRYGVEYVLCSDEVKEKIKNTIEEKYGDPILLRNKVIMDKIIQTNLNKYGVKFTSQASEVKEKMRQTLVKNYGVDSPMKNKDIRAKALRTCAENGKVPTSRQQLILYDMIKAKFPSAKLNFPFHSCALDIFIEIDNIKIDCEYDAWYYHQDQQRDLKRDKFLRSNGFKILRIRSGKLLPDEQELFDTIDYLVNTEHHFKEIILSDWKEKEGEECQKQLQVAQ